MRYDAITIGSAVRDIFLFLDPKDAPVIKNPQKDARREKLIALEQGAKIDALHSERTIGGGGANAAVTFSRQGLNTAAVVAVGDDEDGAEVRRSFKSEGIDTRFVQAGPKQATGFSAIIVAGAKIRDRAIITERGASDTNNFSPKVSGITNAAWYYTSVLSGNGWKKELTDISGAVKKHNINWAWNPGSAQLSAGLKTLAPFMKACTVFNVNRDEALELTGAKNDIKALLSALLKAGPKSAIISDGINGVYYADAGQMLVMRADKSIKALEPTGAGDAFCSGFVAGLIASGDVVSALDAGITNSESVICSVGAQKGILTKAELSKSIKKRNHKLSHV
ncbi:MAG: carbohydrate kinase family protein [Patescibacteria group bacterium]|nr:carbohydrate kinase family protein [Patescibacteria group bacterium]